MPFDYERNRRPGSNYNKAGTRVKEPPRPKAEAKDRASGIPIAPPPAPGEPPAALAPTPEPSSSSGRRRPRRAPRPHRTTVDTDSPSIVGAILGAVDALTSPVGTRSSLQTAEAATNLGLKPSEVDTPQARRAGSDQLARTFGADIARLIDGVKAPDAATPTPMAGSPSSASRVQGFKDLVRNRGPRRATDIEMQLYGNVPPTGTPERTAASARDPLGKKTLGNASTAELARAAKEGRLKISKKGILSTPKVRKARTNLLAAQKAAGAARTLGRVREHGQLTPQEIGTLLVEEGRKLDANLSPAEIAEGIGVAEAESAGNADEQRQLADFSNPEKAHIGLYAEEGPSFGSVPERLNARDATRSAIERFLADGRSWNPAWVHWQEVQGENETGADRAPRYAALAQALAGSSSRAPKALRQKLHEAEAEATEAGLDPKVILGKGARPELGPIKPQTMSRFRATLAAAKALAHADIPYVWGGGHGAIEESPTGLDCSGAVSWVLNKIGVLKGSLTSGQMGQVLEPGPGAVTVYYNAEHTFMKIGKRFFGTSVDDSSKGLAFYGRPPKSYLETFNVGHVPGLGKKVALQLGVEPSELTSGGSGIEYSTGGTTATIEPGAGAEVSGGAQYSDRPVAPAGASSGGIALASILSGAPLTTPVEGDERQAIEELVAGSRRRS